MHEEKIGIPISGSGDENPDCVISMEREKEDVKLPTGVVTKLTYVL